MKKSKPKKKITKKGYKKKMDALWSKIVRARDKECAICKTKENLQGHHCIVRKAQGNATRWDTSNGIALCYHCHIIELHGYATESIVNAYMKIINERYSEDDKDALRAKSKGIVKDSWGNLEQIYAELEEELSQLSL